MYTEMKSSIAMAEKLFKKKKNLLTRKSDLNIRNKEVICYIMVLKIGNFGKLMKIIGIFSKCVAEGRCRISVWSFV